LSLLICAAAPLVLQQVFFFFSPLLFWLEYLPSLPPLMDDLLIRPNLGPIASTENCGVKNSPLFFPSDPSTPPLLFSPHCYDTFVTLLRFRFRDIRPWSPIFTVNRTVGSRPLLTLLLFALFYLIRFPFRFLSERQLFLFFRVVSASSCPRVSVSPLFSSFFFPSPLLQPLCPSSF